MEIVVEMQKRFDLPVMHHFTCVKHTTSALRSAIAEMKRAGICNILALKGDPPVNEPNYRPGPDEPRFGYELIKLIREYGGHFAVGVAGFPEGHINTPTKELDSKYLKIKQDAGADFVATQLFFDNTIYYEFTERVRKEGVTMRLLPGILPITDYAKLIQFCQTCGATIPQFIKDMFEPLANDPDATYKKGVEFAIKQCQDLIDHGSPGLHFFCLNKVEPITTVYKALKR
ncbi:MAG: methylenetetrahydrofolate reductase [Planctomycetes bacterium]|nr:methylenetetrahydrofolate reductase [Planctomycetota bacterium]